MSHVSIAMSVNLGNVTDQRYHFFNLCCVDLIYVQKNYIYISTFSWEPFVVWQSFLTGSSLYDIPLFIAILPEAHVDSVSIPA